VSVLPEALVGWGPFLTLFDSAVITAMAPMLDRLSRAIGPMAADDADPHGDPAGYDSVATHGSYERLLPSEWLLADELPDEFLRRAVAREHLFYALARERPRGRRATTVLVDVGPELFGTPRIAALAALLVLGRRASLARASFGWKVAQVEGDGASDLGMSGIRLLLMARAAFACDEDALRSSVEAAMGRGEAWVVSGPRAARTAARLGASVLSVEDVIEPNVRELSVGVHARGQPRRETRLPLPDERACLRVLRDPFPQVAPPTVRNKVRGELAVARPLISPQSSNVYARLANGGLLVLPLPRSRRQDVGKGRALHLDDDCGEIVAAGHVGGKPAVVAQRDYDLTFVRWEGGERGMTRRLGRSHEALRPLPRDGRLLPLVSLQDRIVFVGRGGRLLEFRPGNRARVLTDDCVEFAFASGVLTYAASSDSQTVLHTIRDIAEVPAPWSGVRSDDVLLAPTSLGGIAVAFESGQGTWMASVIPSHAVTDAEGKVIIDEASRGPFGKRLGGFQVPRSSEVVAVLDHIDKDRTAGLGSRHIVSSPALLLLENDGWQLRFTTGVAGIEFSIALPARAVHVVVHAATRVAVCITDSAELILVALAWRSIFARFTGRGRLL
jgi:hypothetical protein